MLYVVTVGDYDDYTILGVFTSKTEVENALQRSNSGYRWYSSEEYRVEEYEENKLIYE